MENQKSMVGSSFENWLYQTILRIRPAELADLIKRILHIQRQEVVTSRGETFWVDPASHFGHEVITTSLYEPIMTEILESLLRSNDTFVDVGGNEGYFSVVASKLVGPGGHVHCIEPQSRLKPVLLKNQTDNNCKNLLIHPVALSDKEGFIALYLRPTTNTGSSGLFNHTLVSGKIENVPTTTLSHFLTRNNIGNIRLLKIDCEGAEDLVVLNGKELFENQRVDFIALEYHHSIRDAQNLNNVHTFLDKCGYGLYSIRDQSIYYLKSVENDLKSLRTKYSNN